MLNVAEQNPATNFLGMEWEVAYYAYTADRVRRANLANVAHAARRRRRVPQVGDAPTRSST